MNSEDFYRARDDRSMRYAGRVLQFDRRIALTAEADFIRTAAGQAAMMTAANLVGRMCRNVVLAFDDAPMAPQLGRGVGSLLEYCVAGMVAADPFGVFSAGALAPEDYVIHLGPGGHSWVVHGSDWDAYVGPGPSPLGAPTTSNPFGASFAAVLAVSKVFAEWYPEVVGPTTVNLLSNTDGSAPSAMYPGPGQDLGRIWLIGAGSVGSAAAFFLSLSGARFGLTTFDMDIVKAENLDRSPLFTFDDREENKAVALTRHLTALGLDAVAEPYALDESPVWLARQAGTPDVLVSAANERNVRYLIESQFPALQIYATTGREWQATMLRHIPPQDPCSCCVFGTPPPVTECAKGTVEVPGEEKTVDAALPFLSFAAGLMAAAELLKLPLAAYPFSRNRAFFTPCSDEVLVSRALQLRPGCMCQGRSLSVHREMVSGSVYEAHYQFEALPRKKQG